MVIKNTYHKLVDFFRVNARKQKNGLTSVAYIKKSYKDDVLYITTAGVGVSNTVKVVTQDALLYDSRTLKEFTKQYNFYQHISKSIIVNLTLINKLSEGLNYIWLGDIKLHVSRRYKTVLKQKLQQYL